MNLADLRLFLHLADALHFGRASRACHVSPSTLSRTIRRLEEEAAASLLERDTRRVRLTAAGERFRAYARQTVESWESLRRSLDEGKGGIGGEIRLYCSVTASYSILPDILGRFRSRFPDVHIRLVTGDANLAIERVVDDAADISVAALPERLPRAVVTRSVTRTPLVFIAAAGERPGLGGPVEWAKVPMIFPESGLIRRHLEAWFRARGVEPHVYGEVSGHEGILSLVSLGLGVGVVPRLVLEKSLIRASVDVLDVRPALPEFHVGFCVKRSNLTAAPIRAFWETLEEA